MEVEPVSWDALTEAAGAKESGIESSSAAGRATENVVPWPENQALNTDCGREGRLSGPADRVDESQARLGGVEDVEDLPLPQSTIHSW